MKIFGKEMGDYASNGNFWSTAISDWFKDSCYDLSDLAVKDDQRPVLDKFEAIVSRAGCTDITQVEYIFKLEQRLDTMEKNLNALCESHSWC